MIVNQESAAWCSRRPRGTHTATETPIIQWQLNDGLNEESNGQINQLGETAAIRLSTAYGSMAIGDLGSSNRSTETSIIQWNVNSRPERAVAKVIIPIYSPDGRGQLVSEETHAGEIVH